MISCGLITYMRPKYSPVDSVLIKHNGDEAGLQRRLDPGTCPYEVDIMDKNERNKASKEVQLDKDHMLIYSGLLAGSRAKEASEVLRSQANRKTSRTAETNKDGLYLPAKNVR